MAEATPFEHFEVPVDDPLAQEHEAVARWIENAIGSLGEYNYWKDLELKSLPSGAALLAGNAEQSRRFVMAALVQAMYWDQCALQIRSQASNEIERMNPQMLPGWSQVWGRRRQAQAVINALLRRKLPLIKDDLIQLLKWCCAADNLSNYLFPIGSITRALERFTTSMPVDVELRDAMKQFSSRLRETSDKEAGRFATEIQQLLSIGLPDSSPSMPETESVTPTRPSPKPAPAGSPKVLDALKRLLGMLPDEPMPTTTIIGPDGFPLSEDSTLRIEHTLLSTLFNEIGTPQYYKPNLNSFTAGKRLLNIEPECLGYAILAAAERHINALLPFHPTGLDQAGHGVWQSRYAASTVAITLLQLDFDIDRAGAFDLLLYLSVLPPGNQPLPNPFDRLGRGLGHPQKQLRNKRRHDFSFPKKRSRRDKTATSFI